MQFRTFNISAVDPGEAERELNQFLRSQRVLDVEKRFHQNGSGSAYWSFCVEYLERGEPTERPFSGSKVDYKEVLTPEQFAVYSRLREVRKAAAEAERQPPFALFNNEQLAEMVQKRITTRQELAQVRGIGEARLDKYGPLVLKVLAEAFAAPSESATPAKPPEGKAAG